MDFLEPNPETEPLIFDSHAHYDDPKFDEVREELLSALPRCGVSGAVTCGCDQASSHAAMRLAEQYEYLYFAAGIHPENIESGSTVSEIRPFLSHPKCVAVGEIGLDYYWRQDNKPEQIALFEQQLALANRLELPVIVHDREAHADTLALLQKHRPCGVVHSFSGSVEMAKELLSIGLYIGVGGVVTFRNAKKLPDVVRMLPADRLLLETDAPYLAPVPYRGKLNHSAMILLTAEAVAAIRGVSVREILKTTDQNAKKMFGLPV